MATEAKKLKQLMAQRSVEITKLDEVKRVAEKAVHNIEYHNNLKCRYKHIESIYETFEKLHNSIILIVSGQEGDEVDVQNAILTVFENCFYHIQAIYTSLFGDNDAPPDPNSATTRQNNVKLPKIELPIFDGNFKLWQTFIDMFESLIHSNQGLSNIEKFNYLLTSLKGTPLTLVKCTPLTSQNYMVAYNSLKTRYDNKRLIATMHWHAIEATKRLSNAENSVALRNLVDIFAENISVLSNIGYPTDQWDFVLFNMLFDRLDHATATRFELECNSELENPANLGKTFNILKEFLNKQCVALDTVSFSKQKLTDFDKNKTSPAYQKGSKFKPSSSFMTNIKQNLTCQLCSQDHLIYNCPSFLSKVPNERYSLIKEKRWCTNCLGSKHSSLTCNSRSSCKTCSRKHHSLLHFDSNATAISSSNAPQPNIQPPIVMSPPSTSEIVSTNLFSNLKDTVLLSTALIEVRDGWGNYQIVRAILDSASQSNFISSKCCNRLGLSRFSLSLDIRGIGQLNSKSSQGVTCSIKPIGKLEPVFTIDCVILPQLCDNLPCSTLSRDKFNHFSNLKLADPSFNIPGAVDILLGAEIFGFLLKGGSIHTSPNDPVALDTIFGWVIMGKINDSSPLISQNSLAVTSLFTSLNYCSLERSVQRLWELEEVPVAPLFSSQDKTAEEIYCNTLSRTQSGRFIVSLPFREPPPLFEGSRDIALRRFFLLERRLLKNPILYKQYCEFMQDYISSNHMEIISNISLNSPSYYIPHHGVIKPDSSTTKLRVVFDASARDLNNKSLNDTLLTGPKLQQDIVSILLRFRLHSVVFTADIKQMYRQILVSENHRNYQRILWRFSPSDPIQDFQLNTVTYGINSSPFLAIRTILQLAQENRQEYPTAASILETDIYVDDIVSGCSSLSSALRLQQDLISLLNKGGFELRKWASNHPSLLTHLPSSSLQIDPLSLDLDTDFSIKLLGLRWNFSGDTFSYNVTSQNKSCTKRSLLSELARIFDPLGFLVPVTLSLKLLIQNIWSSGIGWDDPPPQAVCDSWQRINSELSCLSNLKVPRRLTEDDFICCELHGFSDASEKAYAAVIYIRTLGKDNVIKTYFVCAKSKVAPLKKLSIPRLELCGALLLSNLLHFVRTVYANKLSFSTIFAWTDSTIVLYWLKGEPQRWTTFVCNRVAKIQEKLPACCWYHVSSRDNPADPASRGLSPLELLNNSLWWAAPSFLSQSSDSWPSQEITLPESTEEQRKVALINCTAMSFINSLLDHFSNILKIQRIICYTLRFIYNCKNPNRRKFSPFSLAELEEALLLIVKLVQQQVFSLEISLLYQNKPLPKSFRKLSPFLDELGILRVGGRLTQANLAYSRKHPALLPSSHRLTWLLVEHTHKQYLHPGVQTLQYIISEKFWIFSPKRTIRKVISQCHQCFRANPSTVQPPMGNLPLPRISQIKPFSEVGVDYGGPYIITMSKTRGAKTLKAYICLFVCMATKAIHIELVSELSTDAFLAALRRFIARRGRCNHIYSDCGTNFVGASKELNNVMKLASEKDNLQWHFNPPSAPNFGGLWEAGIKSVKSHLSRVIGAQILTYEELYTVLVQIEAVLNSRPLCPQSSDPSDLSVLTPGHFLTIETLNTPPGNDLTPLNINRLSRWQLLQRLHQDFWYRWHREYLHTLLQRSKWIDPATPILTNTVVLLKDDHLPPLKWSLGRVIDVHPGADGITRVITIKTLKGVFKRPVNKVCPLPVN